MTMANDPHPQPLLVDAHLDLAFNLVNGLDLRLPLEAARVTAYGRGSAAIGMTPMATLPALRRAGARVVFGTLFVMPEGAPTDMQGLMYGTPDAAHAQGWAQLQAYHALAAEGEITLVGNRAALAAAVAVPTTPHYPIGVVPLMEGADPIRNLDELPAWYAAGLRLVGPAWGRTRYAGGTLAPGPLTAAGRDLVAALAGHGLALDVSHLAEASFWEALELHGGAVCASHANCRQFVPTDRHLSDDMLRALFERGAVVGVVVFNKFLRHEWDKGHPKHAVTLADAVRHIEHMCELAGNTTQVGIGSDIDGGFGVEGTPAELGDYGDLPRIGVALRDAGWQPEAINGVLGGNWLRWLETTLPAL